MRKLFLIVLLFSVIFAKDYTIKMATIVPEGSGWMKEMHKFEDKINTLSDGKITFKTYAGGIMGGEMDMLRKMRYGQIDAAVFTGVGLGEILPEVRVLELPFLFRNSDEVDYVFDALLTEFQEKFLNRGYYFVAWAESGFVYLYTQQKVTQKSDLQKTKMWLWKDDPLAREVFKIMDIPAVPLDITDVYTSLQTNMINGFYISPYAAIAMQWFTKADYMLDYPLTHSLGGVLMTKRKMKTLPENLQQLLIRETKKSIREIVLKARNENIRSIQILQENGIELVSPKATAVEEFKRAGQQTSAALAGKLYDQELLDKVITLLKEYRRKND